MECSNAVWFWPHTQRYTLCVLQVDVKPSLPSVTVFMTIRHVPLPVVLPAVRAPPPFPTCTAVRMLTGHPLEHLLYSVMHK